MLGGGFGLALAVAAFGGLFGIGLDLAFLLPHRVRWLVWGGWLGSIGLVLAVSAFRAFARPAEALALASRAEHCDPASGPLEALTASVSLAHNPNGSPALIAALARQAAGVIERMEPSRIVPSRHAIRRMATGACLFALLVAPAVLAPPGSVRTSVRRFLAPWLNLERVGAFQITVEPGDGRAAIGSKPVIRVVARASKEITDTIDDVWIEWRDDEAASRSQRLAMNDDGDGSRFSIAMPRLKGAVSYRAVVGSTSNGWGFDPTTSASPWYRLIAVEPPRVIGLQVTVEPPPGSRRPRSSISITADESATIEAWRDSRLVFGVSTSARLRSLAVDFTADGSIAAPRPASHAGAIAADRRSATATFPAQESGVFTISLVDESGIAGAAESLHRLIVRVDTPTGEATDRDPPEDPEMRVSKSHDNASKERSASLARRRLEAVRRATARLRQEVERLRYAADAASQGNGAWDAERHRALVEREDEARDLIEDLQRLAASLAARTDPEADFHALAPMIRDAAGREGEASRAALERARRLPPEAVDPEIASKRLDALRQADAQLAALAARLDAIQANVDAARSKPKPGQGSDGPKSDIALKDAHPGSKTSDAKAARVAAGAKPGESSEGGARMAGKQQPGRGAEPGKPGNGSSAPTGYPAAHEDAEPIPEVGAGDLAALRDILRGRSGRPWADLPGRLRSKILRMPQVRFRDEYSRQIERYYRALAEPSRPRGQISNEE
jgi:hypothetical protein